MNEQTNEWTIINTLIKMSDKIPYEFPLEIIIRIGNPIEF